MTGGDASAVDIRMQISFRVVVAGHVMQLVAFFVQPHPEATILREHIFHFHRDHGPDTRKAVEHEADKGLVAQIAMCEVTPILSSSIRTSAASRTGVLPLRTTCFGPRTAAAGLVCMT
jgi:hypothetical protein